MPGLIGLLQRLPADCQPAFIRGDCEWGNDPVMRELEAIGQRYLFKLKRSKRVKALIAQVHGLGVWTRFNPDDKHGVTNDMTKDQLNDLIEYLKTL